MTEATQYEIERQLIDAVAAVLEQQNVPVIKMLQAVERSDDYQVAISAQENGSSDHIARKGGKQVWDIYEVDITLTVLTNRNNEGSAVIHWQNVGKVREVFSRNVNEINLHLNGLVAHTIRPTGTTTSIDQSIDQTEMTFTTITQIGGQ